MQTDHSALTTLLARKNPASPRLLRWALALQEFKDFQIVHRPDSVNSNADRLSRLVHDKAVVNAILHAPVSPFGLLCSHGSATKPSQVRMEYPELATAQWADPFLSRIRQALVDNQLPADDAIAREVAIIRDQYVLENDVLHRIYTIESSHRRYHTRKLVAVPQSQVANVMRTMHNNIEGGHLGVTKTYEKIRLHFHWPNMYRDIRDYVRQCTDCAQRKPPARAPQGYLMPIQASAPWEVVGVDIMGPLPITNSKNRYIIVFTDYMTKWVEAFPMKDADAATVAQIFVKQIITRHGAPRKFISDRGSVFMSELCSAIYEYMSIDKLFTTPYHPQTDGLTERFNKTLAEMLTPYVDRAQANWDELLPYVLLSYRTSVQASTRETSFLMMYGRDPFLPLNRIYPSQLDETLEPSEWTKKLHENLSDAYKLAEVDSQTARAAQQRNYNIGRQALTYEIGQLVWFYNPKRIKGQVQKLSKLWTGPFMVKAQLSPNVYELTDLQGNNKFAANIARVKACEISLDKAKKMKLKGAQLNPTSSTIKKGERLTS